MQVFQGSFFSYTPTQSCTWSLDGTSLWSFCLYIVTTNYQWILQQLSARRNEGQVALLAGKRLEHLDLGGVNVALQSKILISGTGEQGWGHTEH